MLPTELPGQARVVLGMEKVSCLERCPHFKGVLIEGSTNGKKDFIIPLRTLLALSS